MRTAMKSEGRGAKGEEQTAKTEKAKTETAKNATASGEERSEKCGRTNNGISSLFRSSLLTLRFARVST
jgi:hypothetical protein